MSHTNYLGDWGYQCTLDSSNLGSMVLIPYLSNPCYAYQFLDCTHLNDCVFVHPHFGIRILLTLLCK